MQNHLSKKKPTLFILGKIKESERSQKLLNPSINSNFTPFHEPKNRSPNIGFTEIIENRQKEW